MMAQAAAGIGTVMGIAGSLQQGAAAENAAMLNSRAAEENATLTRIQTAENVRRFRVTARKQLGDIRNSIGASGVSMEGSALDFLEESAATAELDAQTMKADGENRARAFHNEGIMQRIAGKNAATSSKFAASSMLLSGAANTLSMRRSN